MTTPKPSYLPVVPENIPDELKKYRQWVCWRPEYDGKSWRKVPYQVNRHRADKTNSTHWTDFSTALSAYQNSDGFFDGTGFVLTKSDPYTAIDLDKCVDDHDIINDQALAIIKRLNSYTEFSPSGHGIRIFVKGQIKRNRRKGDVEVYGDVWYVTVTGHIIQELKP